MSDERPKGSSRYTKRKMSERAVGLARRAYSIPTFCSMYDVSRAKAYTEIEADRLKTYKIGRLVRIAAEDAEAWFRSYSGGA